ncbi:MAG: flagellar basal body-associated FliL family protein [Anaerolineae bacterium]|nr:flagellar basal body-associated FliL family protein [Anaerolineae bacterium]
MKKFSNPKILIPAVVTVLLLGMVAYVLLAPETWWKPIYIEFDAEAASANTSTPPAATPESQAPEMIPAIEPGHLEPASAAPQLVMPAIQPGQGVMYQLEPKVVNLAEPGGLRYLQAGIVLEFHPTVKEYYQARMSGETAPAHGSGSEDSALDPFQGAIDAMRPVIDDIVTTVLSSKTFNEISTIEGKQVLKQELITKINAVLGYQGIVNIYFTEFVVQ